MMEAVFPPEMLTVYYQTTRCHTLAGRNPNSTALTTLHRVGKYFTSYVISLGKGNAPYGHTMMAYMGSTQSHFLLTMALDAIRR